MDEFGTLTQSFGLKPQGKSAPMAAPAAASKGRLGADYSASLANSNDDSFFSFPGGRKPQNNLNDSEDYGDIFGGPPNIQIQKQSSDGDGDGGSSSSLHFHDDFLMMASPPKSSSQFDDLLTNLHSSGGCHTKTSDIAGLDDLLPGFAGCNVINNNDSKSAPSEIKGSVSSPIDELEDFAMGKMSNSANEHHDIDELEKFAMGKRSNSANKHQGTDALAKFAMGRRLDTAIEYQDIDELENFAMGKRPNNASDIQDTGEVDVESFEDDHVLSGKEKERRGLEKERKSACECSAAAQENQQNDLEPFFSMGGRRSTATQPKATSLGRDTAPVGVVVPEEKRQSDENDLESFFSMDTETGSATGPRSASAAPDIMFDEQFKEREWREKTPSRSAASSLNPRKDSSSINFVADLSFMFGAGTSFGEFQEIEGEGDERRRARWNRYQETKERMARAVADMNQRDFQMQQEQEERHRVAEVVITEIKQWSAGKEGNLRALLSTLQYVLWSECGWLPVSLTDLITSDSVKKVYKKATLCVHPDKVQQKGANTQQKLIAEKVFDLLKEAWNKFKAEELH